MYFLNKSSRFAWLAGSALLLALFVPSPAFAVQDSGGTAIDAPASDGNQFFHCGSDTGAESSAPSWLAELADLRLPVLVSPGEGGKTLLHRK